MRFLEPMMLWALSLVPLLVAGYLLLQRRRKAYTVRFTNLELLGTVAPKAPGWRRHLAPALLLLSFAVLIGAMARPSMSVQVPKQQSSVVLVLDVSRSMSATDLAPDRMTAAKRAAHEFIGSVPGSLRLGVVAFSNSAHLVSPLSRSRAPVRQAISSLTPVAGTAMGDGIAVALQEIARLRASQGDVPASILLLSDGKTNRGTPPGIVASEASRMKVPIFAVGIGTEGAVLELGDTLVPVDLDEQELRSVTDPTGGSYFESASAESLEEVYRKLGSALGYEKARREVTPYAAGLGALLLLVGASGGMLWYQRIP